MPSIYLYSAILIYIIAGFITAYLARREMKQGVMEYFLSGRNTGGFVAALSYSATTYSAFMMIGLAGFTYSGGVGALGFELVYLSGLSLTAFFGPRFWLIAKKNDYISPYEMLGDRYQNHWIAVTAALSACVFLIPYLAVQLMGVGYLLSGLSGGEIPFAAGVILASVLAIAWVLIAGMKSVTWTDSLQSLIMMTVSLLILGYIIYTHLGGFINFFGLLSSQHPEFLTVPGPGFFSFKTFLSLSLPWFFFSISNPQVSQRLFIPRDLAAMRTMIKGFLGFGFIYTLVSVIWGFSAKLLIPGLENADMAAPQLLASEYVPNILALIAMIGITAAAISTIDSIMLTLSSVVVRDLLNKYHDQDNLKQMRQLTTAKASIIIIAVLGILFAVQELDLIAALSVAASVGLMAVVPSIFGAFFWKGATAAGSLSSIIIASFTAVYLQLNSWRPFGYAAGVWTFIVSVLVFITVSFFTEAPKEKADDFIDYLSRECELKNII